MYLSQGAKDTKNSIEYCHKAMEVMEQIGTCESKFMENGKPFYEVMGFRYEEDKNYLKAIEYYIKGLENIENCQGSDNDNYISLAKTIGTLYSIYLADNTNSLLYKSKALSSTKKLYGIKSKEYCDVAISLIADMRFLNRFDEAQALCDSTISSIKTNPELKKYLSWLYNQRGLIASELHYTRKAIENFNKAVETADDINDAISFLLNRDSFWGELGFDATSNFLYIDSLINTNPDVSDKTRFTFYNKAAIYFADSDKELANRYYNLADYYSKDLSPHRKVLLRLSQSLSEPNQAKRYSLLLDAIKIFEENHLKDSMVLANVYSKLAGYYEDVQDYNNAIDHYIKAIKIYNSINVDVTNHSFLTCLNNVGLLMSDIKTLKFVYNIRKTHLSPFSPVLYTSFKNLISKSLKKGDVEFADSLFKKDGLNYFFNDEAIYENRFLSARIKYFKGDILGAIDNLSGLENDLEKFPHHQILYYETLLGWKRKAGHDVYDIWEKLLRFYKRKIISKLLYYSNSERKNILFEIQYYMNDLVKDGKDDPRFMPLIADYSLFSKGLLLTTGHQIQKILRKDKTAQQLYRECRSKRIKRNSLSPSDSILIAALDREITLLEKQISDRVGPQDLIKHLNYSSSDLFKTIGKKQMAIDFILTESDSIKDYYAMIYRDNKLDYIHLFSKNDIARYEGMGESGINAMSKPLFGKLIWGKLLPYLKGYNDVYFAPVSSLNRFAIELLPILTDSVPDMSFHRVLRLEKEMFSKIKKISTQEIVAFGNVDYDKVSTEETTRGQSSRKWGQLYATEAELKNIQAVYSKSHLGFYEKADASEGNFKNLDNKNINILHLATHGFYLSDLDILAPPKTKYYPNLVSASGGQGRGGLLLCGANYSWYHAVPDSIEDGILTTEEIEELSFDNLELVVQSACETGLGESNTDGVWGLQRAFRIAGATRQIVSLLRVDDERTKEFMGELHKNISKSKDVYESYRTAQRYMYNKYKSNPRFWASFILLE
jgi:tetratricopeptide (TPR) repeat protein